MHTLFTNRQLILAPCLSAALILSANSARAQDPSTSQDSTVTYPAEYFAQFNPYSVNDMLQRIPGISLARSGSRSESRGGGRGLGGRRTSVD